MRKHTPDREAAVPGRSFLFVQNATDVKMLGGHNFPMHPTPLPRCRKSGLFWKGTPDLLQFRSCAVRKRGQGNGGGGVLASGKGLFFSQTGAALLNTYCRGGGGGSSCSSSNGLASREFGRVSECSLGEPMSWDRMRYILWDNNCSVPPQIHMTPFTAAFAERSPCLLRKEEKKREREGGERRRAEREQKNAEPLTARISKLPPCKHTTSSRNGSSSPLISSFSSSTSPPPQRPSLLLPPPPSNLQATKLPWRKHTHTYNTQRAGERDRESAQDFYQPLFSWCFVFFF